MYILVQLKIVVGLAAKNITDKDGAVSVVTCTSHFVQNLSWFLHHHNGVDMEMNEWQWLLYRYLVLYSDLWIHKHFVDNVASWNVLFVLIHVVIWNAAAWTSTCKWHTVIYSNWLLKYIEQMPPRPVFPQCDRVLSRSNVPFCHARRWIFIFSNMQ